MRMRNIWKQLLCLLLIGTTVLFIFYNSAQPVPASEKQSTNVAESIAQKPKEDFETPADWHTFVTHVRKAAHAVEFFALGLELSMLFLMLRRKAHALQAVWNTLSVALTVAVADESIQILSGRGPKVQDVLLDFCGAVCAVLLVSAVYFTVRAVRMYKIKKIPVNKGESEWK